MACGVYFHQVDGNPTPPRSVTLGLRRIFPPSRRKPHTRAKRNPWIAAYNSTGSAETSYPREVQPLACGVYFRQVDGILIPARNVTIGSRRRSPSIRRKPVCRAKRNPWLTVKIPPARRIPHTRAKCNPWLAAYIAINSTGAGLPREMQPLACGENSHLFGGNLIPARSVTLDLRRISPPSRRKPHTPAKCNPWLAAYSPTKSTGTSYPREM